MPVVQPLPTQHSLESVQLQLQEMQQKYAVLRRWMLFIFGGILLAFSIVLMSFKTQLPKLITTYENNVLKVRGLVVVDSNGVERVWVGAPAPDPLIFGTRISRGDGFNGILLFDKNGTERSGYGTFDGSNSVGITLDEAGRMVANFIAQEAGGVKLTILDEYNNQIGIGTYNKGPYIKLLQRENARPDKLLLIKADTVTGLNPIP